MNEPGCQGLDEYEILFAVVVEVAEIEALRRPGNVRNKVGFGKGAIPVTQENLDAAAGLYQIELAVAVQIGRKTDNVIWIASVAVVVWVGKEDSRGRRVNLYPPIARAGHPATGRGDWSR